MLRLAVGDEIELTANGFERLAAAYLAAIETTYLDDPAADGHLDVRAALPERPVVADLGRRALQQRQQLVEQPLGAWSPPRAR